MSGKDFLKSHVLSWQRKVNSLFRLGSGKMLYTNQESTATDGWSLDRWHQKTIGACRTKRGYRCTRYAVCVRLCCSRCWRDFNKRFHDVPIFTDAVGRWCRQDNDNRLHINVSLYRYAAASLDHLTLQFFLKPHPVCCRFLRLWFARDRHNALCKW